MTVKFWAIVKRLTHRHRLATLRWTRSEAPKTIVLQMNLLPAMSTTATAAQPRCTALIEWLTV